MSILMTAARGRVDVRKLRTLRRVAFGLSLAGVIAACSATATPAATPISSVAGATATSSASSTPTASVTPTPSPTDTAAPSATATPTHKPTPKPTPLPALAIGLCTGSQLKLTLDYWIGSSGTDSYAHVHLTNVSSASCNMRGSPRSQIVSGSGSILVDGGGEIKTGDPVYTMAPDGVVYDTIVWHNWCKSAPKQKVTVAVYIPFGLGRLQAKANGNAPIAYCFSASSKSTVDGQAWMP
jgi:hypothetical protein